MIKFPGGTPNRWEKIAVEIGRSVDEVGDAFLLYVQKYYFCSFLCVDLYVCGKNLVNVYLCIP